MAEGTAIIGAQSGLLDAQAAQLVQRTRAASAPLKGALDAKQDAKIDKASADFESILLGSWLQGAEKSFGSVPGGDGEDDDDNSKDQFQGIAIQALGSSMTAAGGIGIAKMIAHNLRSAAERSSAHGVGKDS